MRELVLKMAAVVSMFVFWIGAIIIVPVALVYGTYVAIWILGSVITAGCVLMVVDV